MFSTETATAAVKTTLTSSSFWTWILYILGFVIIVLAVLMLSGYKFNTDIFGFLRSSKMSIDAASTVFWKPSEQYGALIVREKEMSKDFKNTRFTMLIDMVWFDTRTMLKNGPYRHILHKGSDELKSLKDDGDSKMVFENGMQTSSCTVSHSADSFGNLPPNGLPKRMNPGIFADPVTNDMIIFIDTEFDNKRMRESMRVPDIPLGTPFRLALVVADHFMEVYINCRLDSTKILRGMPLDVDPEWYGLSGPASLPAMIQNLKIWNYPLSSHDIKTQCSSMLPEFKLSKACATKMKETATEAAPAAAPAAATGISYGNTLGKC